MRGRKKALNSFYRHIKFLSQGEYGNRAQQGLFLNRPDTRLPWVCTVSICSFKNCRPWRMDQLPLPWARQVGREPGGLVLHRSGEQTLPLHAPQTPKDRPLYCNSSAGAFPRVTTQLRGCHVLGTRQHGTLLGPVSSHNNTLLSKKPPRHCIFSSVCFPFDP